MDLYFSQYFDVDPAVLETYGAFDISVYTDLPLFIDPFLLFNSKKPKYQALHEAMIEYLVYLRDKASLDLDPGLVASLYQFKEVKQNWLGFTLLGNGGRGLGPEFATRLNAAFVGRLRTFGEEKVTDGTHIEKLGLIRSGVGRDSISDFTTNLIKDYLLQYSQEFARKHIDASRYAEFAVTKARFNFDTESWETLRYVLPAKDGDFVLLTPVDILTRDDTWISYPDMVRQFAQLPAALPDDQLRAQVNNYFRLRLSRKPTQKERQQAAQATIDAFPELIEWYIKMKEDEGDKAVSISAGRVIDTFQVFVARVRQVLADLDAKSDFYEKSWTSYDEALDRALAFKAYVEDQDGYRLINRAGRPFSKEEDVQLFFGLIWCRTDFDVNREPNNGRGPVDFKVSYGAGDKSLIEFKLASNSQLKRNLQNQVAIYEAANKTRQSVKVIICYTVADQRKVAKILKYLRLTDDPGIVVVDARSDNKPSASKA